MSIVTLALAKEFLEISHSAQDNVVQALIDGAEEFLARHLGVVFTSAARVEDLDGGELYLYPTLRPVTALTSVVDLWSENAAYSAKVIGDTRLERATAAGRPLGNWPEGSKRFRATYTGGFAAMPAMVKQAVLMMVKRAYDARGGEGSIGAAGVSVSWPAFMQSDIAAMVREYSRVRMARIG